MLMPSSYHSPVIPKPDEPCLCGKSKSFSRCCGSKKKNRPPPAGLHIKRALIKPEACDAIVAYADQQAGAEMLITHGNRDDNQLVRSLERESTQIDLGVHRKTIIRWVETGLRDIAQPAMGLEVENFNPPNLMRYDAGGYYHAHSDSEIYYPKEKIWKKAVNRDISLLLYLNDDFEGGGLRFTYFNYHYQPRKGDLVLFPSDHRYMHEAQIVTKGRRYVVVSWAAAKGTEKV